MPSQIIWVIVLMLVLMSVFHTNPDTINLDGMKGRAQSGAITASIDGLMLSRSNYQQFSGQTLPIADWEQELRQSGVATPKVGGFTFSYDATAGQGHYFCVTSNAGNTSSSRWRAPRRSRPRCAVPAKRKGALLLPPPAASFPKARFHMRTR